MNKGQSLMPSMQLSERGRLSNAARICVGVGVFELALPSRASAACSAPTHASVAVRAKIIAPSFEIFQTSSNMFDCSEDTCAW